MTALSPNYREDIVAQLGRKIDEMLGPLFPRGMACALLDFPNYTNVGDSAIWLGERVYLRRIGVPVLYTCDYSTYSQDQLTARLREGTILLSGGGNLGDLWPVHQRFREKIIAAFPDRKIIQLPQTIHFQKRANLEQARGIFNAHPDLTILVRDTCSLDFARNEFRAKSILCPDMAFALGTLSRPHRPRRPIIWLSRTDIESARHSFPKPTRDVKQVDWLKDWPSLTLRVNNFLTRRIYSQFRFARQLFPPLSRTNDRLARERLIRGCSILSSGQVVITDRLHGHILCLLLGIPHVLLNNSYGKVRSVYETWTRDSELAAWANSPDEAVGVARAILQSLSESSGRLLEGAPKIRTV